MYRYLAPLLPALYGCATSLTAPAPSPEGPPTLVGPIVAEDLQFGAMNGKENILVRPASDECGIVFAIDAETNIQIRTAEGELRRGTLKDLAIGRTVRAWSTGIILESCPGQTGAAAVEVLE
jgi:hypothetical protein